MPLQKITEKIKPLLEVEIKDENLVLRLEAVLSLLVEQSYPTAKAEGYKEARDKVKRDLEELMFWNNTIEKQIIYADDFDEYFSKPLKTN